MAETKKFQFGSIGLRLLEKGVDLRAFDPRELVGEMVIVLESTNCVEVGKASEATRQTWTWRDDVICLEPSDVYMIVNAVRRVNNAIPRVRAVLKRSNFLISLMAKEHLVYVDPNSIGIISPDLSLLAGYSVAVTGSMLYSRDVIKALVQLNGGIYKSSVSKNCDILVAGLGFQSLGGSTKMKKARRLGVKIIEEADFMRMIGRTK